jgi:hypothetical protein
MKLRLVKAHEIPLHLLRQKKMWDLEVFYRMAILAEDWWAFMLSKDGEDIGAFILHDDPLYDSVGMNTMIIDKQYRTYELVEEAGKLAQEAALIAASELGRSFITTSTLTPERHIKMMGNEEDWDILQSTIIRKVPK